ncbi:MAG TPA: sulfotransferase [Acidimicrobiales bacterium]|nr:sulfotransferase [Acidimicrobiales bacterium]
MRIPLRAAADEERPTPNLFVVGAPKSGTTALASYLGQHPEIFVAGKELSYFGSDLVFGTGTGERWRLAYEPYLRWFAGQEEARYRADRSVFYLYSRRAAAEIHAFDPTSRIVAMVRNPVEQMYSQHSEMLFQGEEDLASFAEALAAEDERRQGRAVPPGCRKPFGLLYGELTRYAEQLERYLERFGTEQVCVVLYDDLRADAAATYAGVLGFLGVDGAHRPEFAVVNANKVVRSPLLRDTLRSAPPGLRRLGRLAVRNEFTRAALRRRLHDMNTRGAPRPALDPALAARVTERCEPEIRRLEALLGRDLGAWRAPLGAPTAPAAADREP